MDTHAHVVDEAAAGRRRCVVCLCLHETVLWLAVWTGVKCRAAGEATQAPRMARLAVLQGLEQRGVGVGVARTRKAQALREHDIQDAAA